jgi:uncharacterized OsmC-like protein
MAMALQTVAAAIERTRKTLARRPRLGMSADAPAVACWEHDLRVVTSHPRGARFASDMPCTLGGGGDEVTPGWLFRAGLAACTATSIAMIAAAEGVELAMLELRANSASDGRGVLGMSDGNGMPVGAGFATLGLDVRIAAPGVPAERLRALVVEGARRSPVYATLARAAPPVLTVDVEEA